MTDTHKLMLKLDAVLKPQAKGYSIAICKGVKLTNTTSGGLAIVDPPIKMTSLTRMDVLSMSKTITAAGVCRLVAESGKWTMDTHITEFLPRSWKLGKNIDQLTLRDVMTHTSGLEYAGQVRTSFEDVRKVIADGTPGILDQPDYNNSNYALFRIMLPYMWKPRSVLDSLDTSPMQAVFPGYLAGLYYEYIQEFVFKPCGIKRATAGYTPMPAGLPTPDEAHWYAPGSTAHPLKNPHAENALQNIGSDYWNLSVQEYAISAAYLTHNRIQSSIWSLMSSTRTHHAAVTNPSRPFPDWDYRCGVVRFSDHTNSSVDYFGHNGGWGGGDGAGAFTCWMVSPDGVTAAVFSNTAKGKGADNVLNELRDAFLAA